MKKVSYEINGNLIKIEVEQEVAISLIELEAEKTRAIWRDKKRKESSLELMHEAGFQFNDSTINIEEDYEEKEEIDSLHNAIKKLSKEQQWLLEQVYFLGRSQTEIARELGIHKMSLNGRLQTTLNKIKKYL